MPEVDIGKLTLKVPAGAASKPDELADRIARQLAGAVLPAVAQELAGLQVSVVAQDGEDDDQLAGRIVKQILRQLDLVS
jgi:hypothetical protein